MSGSDTASHSPLFSLWNVHRATIHALGHALHGSLPPGDPPVTIHGRDLRPDEGVGLQVQLMLTGELYGGDVESAYYVLQFQLTKRTTSVAWRIDAMPVLQRRGQQYDLFATRSYTLPLRDRARLATLVTGEIADDAARFFTRARAGEPIPDAVTPFLAEPTTEPAESVAAR